MITKIIHYVWVGNKPKPELVERCIASWKKFCPDYEIKEWNNDCLAQIDNTYVKEAIECQKWAFASDYIRLYALHQDGGFYCDTDLEITQSLDEFLEHDFVTGYESYNGGVSPITALMGASKGNAIIADLLADYDNCHFIVNGEMDLTNNVVRISSYFQNQFKLKPPYHTEQKSQLNEQSFIYPSYYFCTPIFGKNNYSIHHFNGSWLEPYRRKVKLSFGKYRLIRFRKNKFKEDAPLPLLEDEKIICTLMKRGRTQLCLVKKA